MDSKITFTLKKEEKQIRYSFSLTPDELEYLKQCFLKQTPTKIYEGFIADENEIMRLDKIFYDSGLEEQRLGNQVGNKFFLFPIFYLILNDKREEPLDQTLETIGMFDYENLIKSKYLELFQNQFSKEFTDTIKNIEMIRFGPEHIMQPEPEKNNKILKKAIIKEISNWEMTAISSEPSQTPA